MVRESPPTHHLLEQSDIPSQDRRTLQGNGGNAGLLPEERDACPRQSGRELAVGCAHRTPNKTGKGRLGQRDQVEILSGTLGRVFQTQDGHQAQNATIVPLEPTGFFRDVCIKRPHRKNNDGQVFELESLLVFQICPRQRRRTCEGRKNGVRMGGRSGLADEKSVEENSEWQFHQPGE